MSNIVTLQDTITRNTINACTSASDKNALRAFTIAQDISQHSDSSALALLDNIKALYSERFYKRVTSVLESLT